MDTPTLKTCVPAIALALAPISANAQTIGDTFQKDTVANTVVLETLPADVFEKQVSDSTTCNFTDAVALSDSTQTGKEIKKDEVSTKIKDGAKKFIADPNTKFMVAPIAKYSITHDVPAFGVQADFKNGNTVIGGDIAIGKNSQKSLLAYDLYGEYDIDMDKGFYVYPKVGLGGAKISYVNNDTETKQNVSSVIPRIGAGVKYENELDNGLKLGGVLEVGGGAVIQKTPESTEYNKSYVCSEISPEYLAKLFAEYKDVVVFVKGGKEAGVGYNVQTGVGFKFK